MARRGSRSVIGCGLGLVSEAGEDGLAILFLVLAGRFLPAFVGLMSGFVDLAAGGGSGFFGFDSEFMGGLAGFTGRGVGVGMPLALGFARGQAIGERKSGGEEEEAGRTARDGLHGDGTELCRER
jgi:hypothetical protein